ncbi:MAG TPA: TonB-dependent siderophore receptor [Sphingomonas sp.]|jgi:outer membrane receptor for ferric coprogen and ferric-rhodotorulic acid|uniref:TonB-dependent siderophore receptor n=1 Tax=Sphingomonas sp. TaxID=28214 RepID=UPI002EDAA067
MTFALALLAVSAVAAVGDENPAASARDEIVVTGQRTEGTDDYGVKAQSTATRFALSQRETPQSVSVVTRAQIQDFQLNDVNALLATVPGITVQAQETDRFYYSARGFDIQTFQIDGIGLPFAFAVQTGSIDTAIYDRIEVLRGAPGLLSSTGNPSAVVNFIRKRPSLTPNASFSAQYGSFDHVRLDGDVSMPLNKDGSIRARAVGALLDTDSYLDRYHLRRWTGYGIVEADVGANTVVSGGYGHQDHQTRGAMWGALPLYYTDGTRIPLARSTNTGPDWAGWNVVDRQIFGDITHRFGNGWTAKISAVRRANSENDRNFYVYGNPDRITGGGIFSYPGAFRGEGRNLTVDAHVAGTVALFGRDHDVMLGVNRSAQQYRQDSSYETATIGLPLTLTTAFDGSFPLPNFPTPYTPSLSTHTRRETGYGLVRINPADRLKIMVGGNYTRAFSEGTSYNTPTDYDRTKFLPFVGATLDLSSTISGYASFATIFNPQTQFDADNRLLAPIEGDTIEAGVKGEWLGGRLNASAAIFQARQKNTAEAAGLDPVLLRTIYRGVDATSQGVELEFGGQLAPGVQATGGYTIMRVRGDRDEPVRTFVPRNTARLNLTYSPPPLPALKIGASFQYQSRIYLEPDGIVSKTTGEQVRITQKGYAVLDLLARYALTERLSISANLKNVTNAKYLGALNFDQGFYSAPRTVLGTIGWNY